MAPQGIVCIYKVVIMRISSKGSRATTAEPERPRQKLAPEFLSFKCYVSGRLGFRVQPEVTAAPLGFLGFSQVCGVQVVHRRPLSPASFLGGDENLTSVFAF